MPERTFQVIELQDLDEVAACWRAAATFDPCDPVLLREKILDDDGVFPELRLAVRNNHRLTGLCVGALRDTPDGRRGYVKLLVVHPDARRQGNGAALLHRVEFELIAAGATCIRIAESAPNYLTPGVDSRNELTIQFLQRRGYVSFAEAYNMRVNLGAPDLGAAMREANATCQVALTTVRRATGADALAVEDFLRQHWAAWLPEVQAAFCNHPISLHVALQDKSARCAEVLGFAAYDANNRGTGWFGPMGTDPACQKRGIGRVLLLRCLWDLHCQGRSTAIIPWVGPLSFYQRHAGAEVDRRFVRMEKLIPPT